MYTLKNMTIDLRHTGYQKLSEIKSATESD